MLALNIPVRVYCLSVACALLLGCSATGVPPEDEEPEPSLRALAAERGLWIGAAASAGRLAAGGPYAAVLATEYNSVTPENALKFGPLRPSLESFAWSEADVLVDFALANGMGIRGHTLVWHAQNPLWLTEPNWTRAQLLGILENHIKTVVGRYKGRITAWDVVNEAVADDGSLRPSIWLDGIGPEYIERSFRWAREADPDALLFYNDYGAEGAGVKSDAVYALVQDLIAKEVPIDGVGLQMHVSTEWSPAEADVAVNMARLAEVGLRVHVTEMDVRMPLPAGASLLSVQAQIYGSMLETCLAASSCASFTLWGVGDADSWIPSHFPGYGAALIFDAAYEPKPAYSRMREVLQGGS